jgi:hypothetical protein
MARKKSPLGDDSVASIYIRTWGVNRARTRSYSKLGAGELRNLRAARELGHTVGYHVDSDKETFATCTDCGMMGSMTAGEGFSGRVFERKCGDIGYIESWDYGTGHDPYTYAIE